MFLKRFLKPIYNLTRGQIVRSPMDDFRKVIATENGSRCTRYLLSKYGESATDPALDEIDTKGYISACELEEMGYVIYVEQEERPEENAETILANLTPQQREIIAKHYRSL